MFSCDSSHIYLWLQQCLAVTTAMFSCHVVSGHSNVVRRVHSEKLTFVGTLGGCQDAAAICCCKHHLRKHRQHQGSTNMPSPSHIPSWGNTDNIKVLQTCHLHHTFPPLVDIAPFLPSIIWILSLSSSCNIQFTVNVQTSAGSCSCLKTSSHSATVNC